MLNALKVLKVLNVLNVLYMPMDASLACWALFLKQTRLTATCYHDIVYNSDNGSEHNESFSFSWYVVVP